MSASTSSRGSTRREHPRPHRRELRGGGAHDHRDDVAAVRGLVLDQAPGLVDAEVDAVARHAQLELGRHPRAVVAALLVEGIRSACGLSCSTTRRSAAAVLRVVLGESLVVDEDDTLGAVAHGLAACRLEPAPEDEGDVAASELPGQLSALSEQLERNAARGASIQLDDRPAVVASPGLLAEPRRLLPGGRRPFDGSEELEDRARRPPRGRGGSRRAAPASRP